MNDCCLKSNSLLIIVVLYVYSPKPFDMYITINLKALDIITFLQTGSHRVNGQYSSTICTNVANWERRVTVSNLFVLAQALILQIGVKHLIRSWGGEYGERGKYNHWFGLTKKAITNRQKVRMSFGRFNPLNPELNPICYLLALLDHHFLHVSRIMVKSLPVRLLMSYIYMTLVA